MNNFSFVNSVSLTNVEVQLLIKDKEKARENERRTSAIFTMKFHIIPEILFAI